MRETAYPVVAAISTPMTVVPSETTRVLTSQSKNGVSWSTYE
jgi:hypothetical protein